MSKPYEEMLAASLSRRKFLGLAGGAAGAALLAACGVSSSSDTTAAPATTAGPGTTTKVGGDLNLYVWEGYDQPAGFENWFSDNGITLNTKYITQPEEVPTVLRGPGGDQWDMSYGDNVVLGDLKNLGLIRPITTDEVPGLEGLLPAFKVAPWKNDDGTYNGVPWTWGFSGVTYRSDRVPEPKSWYDLLDPQYQGRVSTVDGALNNVALASIAVGIDPDELTTDQLNGEVKDFLTQLFGQIRTLAPSIGDQISLLVSGDIDYMVVGLKFMDAETAAQGVETSTVVPSEGAIGWADTAFIPPTAPHPENAFAFLNHLLDPKVNAEANSDLLQGPGVEAAIPLLSDEAKAQYPFDDIENYLENTLTFNRGFPREKEGDRATYDEILAVWEEVKSA